jgi:hypothetical protein
MVRAFLALRSSSARAVTLHCRWDKETIVIRRERHHPQLREIQSTFEPSRLSLSWLAQAYEQVVPIIRRPTSGPLRRPCQDAEEPQGRWPQRPAPLGGESTHRGAQLP